LNFTEKELTTFIFFLSKLKTKCNKQVAPLKLSRAYERCRKKAGDSLLANEKDTMNMAAIAHV